MPGLATVYLVTGLRFAPQGQPDEAETYRDQLADKLAADYPSISFQRRTHKDNEDLTAVHDGKLMLVGHSFGGDACIRWIENAPDRTIDVLLLLDPVPDDSHMLRRWNPFYHFSMPMNVKQGICYSAPGPSYPLSKTIRADRPGLENYNLSEGHGAFFANATIEKAIRDILDPWTRQHE
jgi:pimeloyl-ACP methyl ester carboxylesterase